MEKNRMVIKFEEAFELLERGKMMKKDWTKIYVGCDVHQTIMKPTWSQDMSSEFYDYAEEAMRLMSKDPEVCLIMWTSSKSHLSIEYVKFFSKFGIEFQYINENPEAADTEYGDFHTKPYFSVGLDDKFGFLPSVDWQAIAEYFRNRKQK